MIFAQATRKPPSLPLQPPSFFSSSKLSRLIHTTAIYLQVNPRKDLSQAIQYLGLHFNRTFAKVNRENLSGYLVLRGTSLPRLKLATTTSRLSNLQSLKSDFTYYKTGSFNLSANMSTRRSARLSAASELKTSSPSTTMTPPPPPAPTQRRRKRKAEADTAPEKVTKKTAAKEPTTPNRRRAQPKTSTSPPATPTPSNVKLMAEPASPVNGAVGTATPPSKKPRPAAVSRLADSNATLATLLSPETSRVVTSKRAAARSRSVSPTKGSAQERGASAIVPKAAATANILEEANRHLIATDPRMRPLVENNHCRIFSPEGLAERIDPFESLCSSIISQQVSGAAAKAIKKRFINLFHEGQEPEEGEEKAKVNGDDEGEGDENPRFPHPSQVASMSLEALRTAGLSQRKAEYVSGLAEKFVSGELSAQLLADAPYDEVITRLTAVRGLGLWSAEMFACFALKRIDVFSLGDLGVQRGMAAYVGRDVAKLKNKGGKFKYMSEADMTELADRFRPYRSLFMWYMWRVEETDVSTME
ncbi:DNA glycosylase [Xylariaceae sp. FL1651]|nr:DNA glycosylase [Xylariaceae sp. FL1651]